MPTNNVKTVEELRSQERFPENPMIPELSRRVTRLEDGHQEIVKKQFSLDTEITAMKRDLSYLRETQDKQTQGINRILWAVGAVLITYVASFVFDGGLVAEAISQKP